MKSAYITIICADCPCTEWGKKSICLLYKKSIGLIDSCPSWDPSKIKIVQGENLAWVQQVDQWIKDYPFTLNHIKKLKKDIAAGTHRPSYPQRLAELEERVRKIQLAVEQIKDERELIVITALLEGKRNNHIAHDLLQVSRTNYYGIKNKVLAHIAKDLKDMV